MKLDPFDQRLDVRPKGQKNPRDSADKSIVQEEIKKQKTVM